MIRQIRQFIIVYIATAAALLVTSPRVAAQAPAAQTLDQQAFNAVWERLEGWVRKGAGAPTGAYSVHVLEVPRTASWADNTQFDGLLELQRIAGAIPEAKFMLDPSRLGRSLHQVYADFALDVTPPDVFSPADEQAYLKANEEFKKAAEDLAKVSAAFGEAYEKEEARIERMGRKPTEVDRQNLRKEWRNRFLAAYTPLQVSFRKRQDLAPVGDPTMDSIRRLAGSIAAADGNGYVGYLGDSVAISELAKTQCDEAKKDNWEGFGLGSTIQVERRADWSSSVRGGGSWGAVSFIGGARSGSNYTYSLSTKANAVSVRICAPRYIALSPGDWWDPELLRKVDRGNLKLKPKSPMEDKKAFGPKGEIPRLVRGVIVARAIAIEANFGETDLNEYKSTVQHGGGVRIGPWRVGGGSTRTEFSRTFTSQTGGYGRSVNGSLPVIIAYVTEETPETQ